MVTTPVTNSNIPTTLACPLRSAEAQATLDAIADRAEARLAAKVGPERAAAARARSAARRSLTIEVPFA